MTESRFQDQVAIVTGAANGIGLAITRRLLEEGARVAACDVDIKAGRHLADQVGDRQRLLFVETDVASEISAQAATAAVARHFGHVDILINNAGIFPNKRFEEISYADWRRVLAVNLDRSEERRVGKECRL